MERDPKAEMRWSKKMKQQPKNRRTKSMLIFDEKSRVDFITGFRKRKKDRQRKVQEEITKKIKEERKLLKQKRKEFGPVQRKKYQSVPPDLEDLAHSQVTELPDHTVTITDISGMDIAGQGGIRLGQNRIKEEQEELPDSDKKCQIPLSSSQISLQQQNKVLRQIGDRIHKRQKHVTTKSQHHRSKGRIPSKKKRHAKKHCSL